MSQKTLVLIDIYSCCDCLPQRKRNIKCSFVCKRDELPPEFPVPPPAIVRDCPRYHKPCNWTYARTERMVVPC